MLLLCYYSYIFIIHLVTAAYERIKRDDASFALDFGGPVAKSVVLNTTTTNSTAHFISANSLYACELENATKNTRNRRDIGPPMQLPGPLGGLRLPNLPQPLGNGPQIDSSKPLLGQGQLGRPNPPNNGGPPDDIKNRFDAFKKQFHRKYGPDDDPSKRLQLFRTNMDGIDSIRNTRMSPFDAQFDVTKFSDMKFDDFKSKHTGAFKPDINAARKVSSAAKKPICKKLQWTSKNVFPKARDQLECGSCYAMSVADLIAAQNNIESKDDKQIEQLSAQYVVDCIKGPNAYKCNGGRPVDILNQLSLCQSCMLPKESCYSYTGKNGTCKTSCKAESAKVAMAEMLDIRGDQEKDVMANLLAWGPVVAIVGVTESWQFYNGTGIIRPRQCSTDQSHAVIITGYDYTTCVPTYTVRNSWGTDWGAKGYVKLEAGKNTCSIAQSVIYACSSKCTAGPSSLDFVMKNSNYPGC